MNDARALANALALARNLSHAGGLARALTDTIDQTLARDRAPSHVPAFADTIAPDIASALDIDAGKAPDQHRDPATEKALRQVGRVSPSAGRLVAAAARMLPEADRADYAEEFRGELRDLTQAGAGWGGQLAYAARQLRSARNLRAALQVAARQRAAP